MMTNPERSRCSTSRSATITDMNSSAVDPLAALKTQREGERVGDIGGGGGS